MEYLANMFLSIAIIITSICCMSLKKQIDELKEKVEQIENVCIIEENTIEK